MRTLVLTVLLAAPIWAAPVPREVRNGPALEGTWEVVTMHSNGVGMEMYQGARWKIGKETIDIEYPEALRARQPSVSNKIHRVDGTTRPRQLDYTNYQGMDRKAVFEIQGDKLTICIPVDTTDRPKELKADTSNLFYTFKRIKE